MEENWITTDKSWLYYGVFFNEATRTGLINKAKTLADIPEDWTLYGDHMTIIYNDGKFDADKELTAMELDNEILSSKYLKINSIGISNEAIAFGVSNYETQNEHSHITIAVAPGSKPVRSNNITEWYPIDSFHVYGSIKKIYRK